MSLSVVTFDGDGARWDSFLGQQEGSTFCHLSGWRSVMEDILGHECHYRVAVNGEGEWEGVLPLVQVRSRIFGHYLLSMPFLNYGGPIGTPAARERLSEDAVELARESSVDLLELRGRGVPPDAPLTRVDRKVTVVLDLPDDPEVLWKDVLKSKVRSQVRRPQKEGMEARFGLDQVEPFYSVFTENMRDLGTPVLPRGLFERIAEAFPNEVEFGCVYLGDAPVAAGCGFAWNGEFEITWASSLREFNRLAPNMLLYWAFMERMIERECSSFNFGRCTPDGGTHRFKKQWGGEDESLPWGQWSPSGISETPNPDRPLFQMATKAWSRLPLPIANRLGPVLARNLP
jgi:serine/alanine adding enzyme